MFGDGRSAPVKGGGLEWVRLETRQGELPQGGQEMCSRVNCGDRRQGAGTTHDGLRWRGGGVKMPLTGLGSPRGEIPFQMCQVQGPLGPPRRGVQKAGARWVWSSGERLGLQRGVRFGVGTWGA